MVRKRDKTGIFAIPCEKGLGETTKVAIHAWNSGVGGYG